jgi:hypothetical protein
MWLGEVFGKEKDDKITEILYIKIIHSLHVIF